MNIIKMVRKKFNFLDEREYICQKDEQNVFCAIHYIKKDIVISLHFDYRCEFLNLLIKKGTCILLETSHDSVIDSLEWTKRGFLQSLKSVYEFPKSTHSLSQEQFEQLIEIYSFFVYEWVQYQQ